MKLPLFEEYPDLEKLPRIPLGEWPTPVQRMQRLGDAEGFPSLYVKRDDLSSRVYGGNKVRKLEFVLGDARAKGRKTLLVVGGTGSNQVLATGIYGAQAGFKVAGVVFDQMNADYVRRNMLLDNHYGVELIHTSNIVMELIRYGWEYGTRLIAGGKPYYVPGGASSPVGNIGYVNAAFEIRRQVREGAMPEPDYAVAAAGSLGTASGLQLGFKLAGMKTRVIGVQVSMPWYITAAKFAGMVKAINDFMRKQAPSVPEVNFPKEEAIMLDDYLGGEYACFTPGSQKTIQEAAELEGLTLDPTYTSKALYGGLDWLKKSGENEKTVLYVNTYNSVDLSGLVKDTDYHDLPRSLCKYFETPTQEELEKTD